MDEWAALVPNELERDAVGLWQFYSALQDSFGLHGDRLHHWTKKIVESLVERGAVPVDGVEFRPVADHFVDSKPSVERIMEHIRSLTGDPDFSEIWFLSGDLPSEQGQAQQVEDGDTSQRPC